MAKKQTPNPADAPAKVPAASDAEEAGQPKEAKKPKARAPKAKEPTAKAAPEAPAACGSRSPGDSAARGDESERASGGGSTKKKGKRPAVHQDVEKSFAN